MPNITMSPEILAQRLEAAAIHYQRLADEADDDRLEPRSTAVRVARMLRAQAQECLDWAEALRGEIRAIGFDSDDRIELEMVET